MAEAEVTGLEPVHALITEADQGEDADVAGNGEARPPR
jgi:hypothetical protein